MPDNISWFHKHLNGVSKTTFEEDHRLFEEGAMNRTRHVDAIKDMIRYMAELYTSPVMNIHNNNADITQETLQKFSLRPESAPTEDFLSNNNRGERLIEEATLKPDSTIRVFDAATTRATEESHTLDIGAFHSSCDLAASTSKKYVSPLHVNTGSLSMGRNEHPGAPANGTTSKVKEKKTKKREQKRLENEKKMDSYISPLLSCASPHTPTDCGSNRLDHPTLAVFDSHDSQIPPETDTTSTTPKPDAVKLHPHHAELLLHSDVWRNCRPCRNIVRQLALRFALLDNTDEDGYEVVERVVT
jgi:hypothetical protein